MNKNYTPKTSDEVLTAVKTVEAFLEHSGKVPNFIRESLEILCERTRTLLQQEEMDCSKCASDGDACRICKNRTETLK